MIERLLPAGVAAADTTTDAGAEELFPAELAVISNAVAKRRTEFSTVRSCARRALAELGVPPGPILPGLRGSPTWPAGIVGSMTHCAGYRAAAVARAGQVAGLGIDAEPHGPLPAGVLELVTRPEERVHLAELADRVGPVRHWDRLLFSIKEAVYKAWFPLTSTWLDFGEASVRIDPEQHRFQARLQVPGPIVEGQQLSTFHGRFLIDQGLVLTAIVLSRV